MKLPIEVMVAPQELEWCVIEAARRLHENWTKGRKHADGAKDGASWDLHVEGCIGEMVLCKAFALGWEPATVLGAPDTPLGDVRTTRYENGRLLLKDRDHDDKRVWLVTGQQLRYRVVGWCYAKDGKKKQYWTDPVKGRYNYFVPQSELNKDIGWIYAGVAA